MSSAAFDDVEVVVGRSRLTAAAFSECGPVRQQNQDAFRLIGMPNLGLGLILADGMGGHAGGAEAATAAIEAAGHRLSTAAGAAALPAAVAEANLAVAAVRRQLGGNPGTTLVAAVLTGADLVVANLGDSRAYLIRDGLARQLTEDHSLVAEQVRAGTLDAAAARHDPRRNYITRALLGDPVDPDITATPVGEGDIVLICSDGLWEPLEDGAIGDILSHDASLREASRRLVAAALEAGSRDNVTVVCASVGVA